MTTMHFIESENKTVTITIDKTKAPKEGYLPYPLRYRLFISEIFQWAMIDAYLTENWKVIMDNTVQLFWNSRPKQFRKSNHPLTWD